MANKPTQPVFPLGLAAEEQSTLAGVLNTGTIEHGPDAVLTLPEGNASAGLPSSVRYNADSDEFEGFYENGGWLPLGGGGGIRWEVLPHASTATLTEGRGYLINNTTGASTVVLPSPTRIGDSVTICDAYGKFATYPLTVSPSGNNLYGSTEDMAITTDNVSATFTWSGPEQGWIITSGVGLGQGRVYSREIFTKILASETSSVALNTPPTIVDVYADGKRLAESKYSLDGNVITFSPSLPASTELQVIEYTPIQLGTGGGSGSSTITWVYNGGSAIGGETEITLDVVVDDVPAIDINGSRQYKNLGFTFDPLTSKITLAQELEPEDEVVVIINGTPNIYNQIDHTLREVARVTNVKDTEVVYFSVGAVLSGYKVIYDKETQRAYPLPADIAPGTTAVSLSSSAVLTHSAGSVDLGELAVSREEYVTLSGTFDTGVTVNTKNELVVFTDGKYRWDGVLPKIVPAGSTPETAGGIGLGAWVCVGDAALRSSILSNGIEGSIIVNSTTQHINQLNHTYGIVRLTDRDNCLFEVLPPGTATPDGYAYLGMPNGYVLALLDSNGSYNVRGAGAVGDGYNDDGLPIASLVKRAMQTKKGDFVFPAVGAGESYVLKTPVDLIFSSATIDPPSFTFRGVGSVNGLSMQTRIAHIRETYGIKQRNIGATYRDFQAIVYCGAPANIISTGVNTITLDRNPFGGNGGTPVTWNSTVIAGDGTQYSSGYVQFATNAGSFYASSFTDNGDGTYTFGNVRHVTSASTDLTTSTRIVRFSCRAHFEPSDGGKYPAPSGYEVTAGFIWADTLENIHIDHVWFLQQLRCVVHDLGAGGSGDSGIGNIGTVSNVIVDGAFSFMTNTDLSASSTQSLNGGHFSNVQFYSVRAPFVGRRIQNINMASLQLFSSDGLFFARDISHVAVPGAILGWDGTTGFCKNIVVCENIEDANFGSCVFGRHQHSTPVMTFNSVNGLSLVGATLGTVSEGSAIGAWMYVTGSNYNISGLNISVSIAHLTGSGRNELTLLAEDTTTTSVNMLRNKFSSRVYTNIARDLRDYDSTSGSYGYLYSGGSPNGGYSFAFSVDVSSWTPSLKRKAIKLGGALTSSVSKTLPSAIAEPDNASDFIIDTSSVALGSYTLTVSGYTLTAGVHVFKWVGSWILVSSK